MASLSKSPPNVRVLTNPISSQLSSVILSFRFGQNTFLHRPRRLCALKAAASTSDGDYFLRKPVLSQGKDFVRNLDELDHRQGKAGYAYEDDTEDDKCVDWEDQILEDTVPLVAYVRMILHSGEYESGDRLSPEHEKTILEKLLPFHPDFEKKIGCGIDYITIGYHPDFERSRCLFIARKDGELIDFSYWKCIKGLIRKNYPLYADSFILRHFRKRRHNF